MFQNYKFYSLIGIISILFFFSKCQEENNVKTVVNPCHCNDLIYDELYNHFFIEERTNPYTGKCQEYFKNGKVSLEKEFVDGKLDGKMITYRKSGKVISIVELKLNFIDGKTIFYDKMGNDSLVQYYKRGELIADGH